MANFEKSYSKVMAYEGEYSFHESDPGGETWKGIARNMWPDWVGWRIIDSVKSSMPKGYIKSELSAELRKIDELESRVKEFYRVNFWNRIYGDKMYDSFQDLADEMFDTAVNMGVVIAVSMLQTALNVFNHRLAMPDLAVDGRFGPKTWEMLNSPRFSSNQAKKNLVKALNILQGARYMEIGKQSPSKRVFMEGWFNRVTV